MKLSDKILAVAMMVGAMGATGCSKPAGDDAIAPEETAENAPVEESNGSPGFEQNSLRFRARFHAPYGPPAARYENPGRAPSQRHFWANGYYRWNGRQHVWQGGRWENRRSGYAYQAPHWERQYGRWVYVPGRWTRG